MYEVLPLGRWSFVVQKIANWRSHETPISIPCSSIVSASIATPRFLLWLPWMGTDLQEVKSSKPLPKLPLVPEFIAPGNKWCLHLLLPQSFSHCCLSGQGHHHHLHIANAVFQTLLSLASPFLFTLRDLWLHCYAILQNLLTYLFPTL